MCGIAGYIHKGDCEAECLTLENLIHFKQSCRGPDAQTTWTGHDIPNAKVHLFHQRLRIQDLSQSADQPMQSNLNQSLRIVFNGEIYNLDEVKNNLLRNFTSRTSSDTEVLIEALASNEDGDVLDAIRGMFAFGTINTQNATLSLYRDRFGEKPLHYWSDSRRIVFSSQYDVILEALKLFEIDCNIEIQSIYRYLVFGYFPYDHAMVSGVKKLAPGSKVIFELARSQFSKPREIRWFAKWKAERYLEMQYSRFSDTFEDVIKEQLIGDVPVGVFLSGGSDSTLVSAIAQKLNRDPIHSFSLGFENSDYDESRYALEAAQQIGTIHHSMKMTSSDASEILPHLLRAYPEPLGDPSVFPTTFISREARKFVTVVLTGDGADELFFGYGRYERFLELRNVEMMISSNLFKQFASKSLLKLPVFKHSDRVRRLSQSLGDENPGSTYVSLIGFGHNNPFVEYQEFEVSKQEIFRDLWNRGNSTQPINRLREIDIDSYLCDDILVKVDRAAMAFGLETRAPFLDYRIQKLAQYADTSWLRDSENKAVIKSELSNHVSSRIFRRPKMGFGAPLGDWLTSSLEEWARSVISDTHWESLNISGNFVENLYRDLYEGKNKESTYLWMLLALGNSTQMFRK